MLCLQRVKGRCIGKHAPNGIKVLPFDLIGENEELHQAVVQAVASFPGVPMSYLVHNAGGFGQEVGLALTRDNLKLRLQLQLVLAVFRQQRLVSWWASDGPTAQQLCQT